MTGESAGPRAPASAGPDPDDDRLRQLLRVDIAAPGADRPTEPASTSRRLLFAGVLVALLCAGVALIVGGTRLVADSTNGRVVAPVDDPTQPGFEALVDPTPTLAILSVDGDDLVGIAVLALSEPPAFGSDGSGGGVVIVPQRTIGDLAVGRKPLEAAFDAGDDGALVSALGVVLDAGIGEREVVDGDRWADLVEPVEPLTIDNPNALYLDGELVFEVGEIDLEADEIGTFLRATAEGENDLARLYRHELFLSAWFDAVAADGEVDAVPGELDSGIGRFVRALSAGEAEIATLPVAPDASQEFGPQDAYAVVSDDAASLVDRLIPLPTSPAPGARARVRVLNGTTDTGRAPLVAPMLPPAGVEVVSVGNAVDLDAEETTIRYGGATFADEARALADILGVDDVIEGDRVSDSFDITVTLGPDAPHAA